MYWLKRELTKQIKTCERYSTDPNSTSVFERPGNICNLQVAKQSCCGRRKKDLKSEISHQTWGLELTNFIQRCHCMSDILCARIMVFNERVAMAPISARPVTLLPTTIR